MKNVKAEWASHKPPSGKVFHIHCALETVFGREPGDIVVFQLGSKEPIVMVHYRKPEGNTFCLQKLHTYNFYSFKYTENVLERASGADISNDKTMKPHNIVSKEVREQIL